MIVAALTRSIHLQLSRAYLLRAIIGRALERCTAALIADVTTTSERAKRKTSALVTYSVALVD